LSQRLLVLRPQRTPCLELFQLIDLSLQALRVAARELLIALSLLHFPGLGDFFLLVGFALGGDGVDVFGHRCSNGVNRGD